MRSGPSGRRAEGWAECAGDGQGGVENVLDIMRDGLKAAMMGNGHSSLDQISVDDLVVPPNFAITAGGDEGNVWGVPELRSDAAIDQERSAARR